MARLFESQAHIGAVCPGEAECDLYKYAGPPQDHVCQSCPLLPTKPVQLEMMPTAEAEALLDEVAWMIADQRMGFTPLLAIQSPLHYELLILWGDIERHYERAQQARLPMLLEAWLRAMTRW